MTNNPNTDDTDATPPTVDDEPMTVPAADDSLADENFDVGGDGSDDEHDGDDDTVPAEDDYADADATAAFPAPPAPDDHTAMLPPPVQRPRAEAAATAAIAWANKWGVPNDPYVRGLATAVSQGESLTMWANTDPSMLLPEPVSHAGRAWRRIARLLVVLRNVAVFVPVALTWMAIHEATGAFAKYANESTASGEDKELNFLVFWQSGGNDGSYLSDFWRIGSVALLDAIIISFIVGATLIASSLESRAKAKEEHAASVAERERTELALRIGAALQGNRNADPEAVSEALANGLNSLSAAARDVSEAAARMEAATSGVNALAPRMAELSTHVEVLSERLGRDVSRSVDALVASVSTLGVTMGGDMHTFLTNVLSGLDEVAERLGKTSVTVEFGTKQLRDDLDAVHARLAQLVNR